MLTTIMTMSKKQKEDENENLRNQLNDVNEQVKQLDDAHKNNLNEK